MSVAASRRGPALPEQGSRPSGAARKGPWTPPWAFSYGNGRKVRENTDAAGYAEIKETP
jgi:hypothetical protein